LYFEIKRKTKRVDKINNIKDALSPDKKIKTSVKINKKVI
jgi:hypothetical protein